MYTMGCFLRFSKWLMCGGGGGGKRSRGNREEAVPEPSRTTTSAVVDDGDGGALGLAKRNAELAIMASVAELARCRAEDELAEAASGRSRAEEERAALAQTAASALRGLRTRRADLERSQRTVGILRRRHVRQADRLLGTREENAALAAAAAGALAKLRSRQDDDLARLEETRVVLATAIGVLRAQGRRSASSAA